mmetsp:Transcript_64963/g.152867  ORF Transcript_64963/g.152867 Transcript_64963/m.152867 type:complete len:213 (-) Transcript_64963:707-1345(-)
MARKGRQGSHRERPPAPGARAFQLRELGSRAGAYRLPSGREKPARDDCHHEASKGLDVGERGERVAQETRYPVHEGFHQRLESPNHQGSLSAEVGRPGRPATERGERAPRPASHRSRAHCWSAGARGTAAWQAAAGSPSHGRAFDEQQGLAIRPGPRPPCLVRHSPSPDPRERTGADAKEAAGNRGSARGGEQTRGRGHGRVGSDDRRARSA